VGLSAFAIYNALLCYLSGQLLYALYLFLLKFEEEEEEGVK